MTYPKNTPLNLQSPLWQSEKHLKSGDRVWLLTDVEIHESRYMPQSAPQTLFKVGIYDLLTEKVGFGVFGRDIAFALVKAGVQPPPWVEPQPTGIVVVRPPHDDGEQKGRYSARVELIELEPHLRDLVPIAGRKFAAAGHCSNAAPGMWWDLVARAERENAVEAAALSMSDWFSVGDVRNVVGGTNVDATSVLQRLVREGRLLPPTGKKRWTKYCVAPSRSVKRVDWTG